jgi:hypothetical protein
MKDDFEQRINDYEDSLNSKIRDSLKLETKIKDLIEKLENKDKEIASLKIL